MANQGRANYKGNKILDPDGSKGPLIMRWLFQAGATQAIEPGTILEFTGNGNTAGVPIDTDFDATGALGSGGKLAIAWEAVESGDLAGYYQIAVPREGDVWEFDLNAASAVAYGTALYFHADSTATNSVLTTTAGTNIIAYSVGQEHYPEQQGHAASGDPRDRGTTVASTSRIQVCFRKTVSFLSAAQRQ